MNNNKYGMNLDISPDAWELELKQSYPDFSIAVTVFDVNGYCIYARCPSVIQNSETSSVLVNIAGLRDLAEKWESELRETKPYFGLSISFLDKEGSLVASRKPSVFDTYIGR